MLCRLLDHRGWINILSTSGFCPTLFFRVLLYRPTYTCTYVLGTTPFITTNATHNLPN